jgi:hypothetical protein
VPTVSRLLPRLTVPVATTPHLIALKVLAGRSQDLTDLGYLIPSASSAELDKAREAVKLSVKPARGEA